MIILLSPAKTMNYKDVPAWVRPTDPQFAAEATQLASELKKIPKPKLAKTLGVSDKIGQLNYERFQSWSTDDNPDLQPAIWAYSGDVYNGLAVQTFTQADGEYAQDRLKILSGLYGIVRPYDLIVPYRLEMQTRFAGKWGKDLYAFWGQKLSDQMLSEQPDIVLNCASNEYAKAAEPHLKKQVRVITPQFYKDTPSGPERKALFSKYTRGVMARWVIKNQVEDAEDLKKFDEEGYRYEPSLSSEDEPVFVAPESFSLLGRFTKG